MLFNWYAVDFASPVDGTPPTASTSSVLEWIVAKAGEETTVGKKLASAIASDKSAKYANVKVKYAAYDWGLNGL